MELLGRLPELTTCREALLGDQNHATAAIIAGAPGIGKTILWRNVAEFHSSDATVLRTTGIRGRQAGLGNLADLLDPVTETAVADLPGPLTNVLLAALGQVPPQAPVTDVLLERATVRLLRALAAGGLVVAVDDEQWLDEDSRRLLEVAAVRLAAAPVRWLVSVRSADASSGLAQVLDHELSHHATWVKLADLDEAMLSELIMSRMPGQWSPGVLRQVISLAAGNPYAALEIARETVASGEQDGNAARVPASLTAAIRRRLERLDPATLAVVQAGALIAAPTRALLSTVMGEPAGKAVKSALEAGILQAAPPDPLLRFSHPLLREAADRMLTGPRRRELQRIIGGAVGDPHEAAWHLARGAEEADEDLAQRLELAARDAGVRGMRARAVELARAAVEFTPDQDGPASWRRRLMWLSFLTYAGEFAQARRQGEKWVTQVPAPLRGRLTMLRSRVEPDVEQLCQLLVTAVDDLAGHDPLRAAFAYAEASVVLGFQLGRLAAARDFAAAAVPYARAAGYPPLLRGVLAADGLLAVLAGETGAGDQLRAAVRLPGFEDSPVPFGSPETALACWHLWRGETGPARELMHTVRSLAARIGAGEGVFQSDIVLAAVEWRAGKWAEAAVHAAAATRWNRESGRGRNGQLGYVQSLVKAGYGAVADARTIAADGLRAAEAQRDWAFAALCRWVLGQVELSLDDPVAALRWLDPISDMLQAWGIGEPGCHSFTPDLIEAWAATGQLAAATERLCWLQDAARRLDHPWARITAGRAAAVVRLAERDPAGAVAAVAGVVPEARERRLPFELGRCLLVLGTAQRKARQRREAAASLDEAIATFRGLGAARWQDLAVAQRARLTAGQDDELTPTERRVAELVANGHSNPEIAASLFISVKTVEANLTRIYRKLGIRGRVELARRDPG